MIFKFEIKKIIYCKTSTSRDSTFVFLARIREISLLSKNFFAMYSCVRSEQKKRLILSKRIAKMIKFQIKRSLALVLYRYYAIYNIATQLTDRAHCITISCSWRTPSERAAGPG